MDVNDKRLKQIAAKFITGGDGIGVTADDIGYMFSLISQLETENKELQAALEDAADFIECEGYAVVRQTASKPTEGER